jgi:hypothetical protein
VIDLSALGELRHPDKSLTPPLVVLHPYKEQDCDLLREIVEVASVARLFVIIWSPRDMVRTWLDGMGAVNLHTRAALGASDAVQLEAARCWVDEQYNGLSSGNGKAAVVQLLRAFTSAGYPLDADTWATRLLRRRRQVPPRHSGHQTHHGDTSRHPAPHHRALPARHPQRARRTRHRNGLIKARLLDPGEPSTAG